MRQTILSFLVFVGTLLNGALVARVDAQPTEDAPTAAGFGERIEVGIVNVDVWVTDATGKPVTGLGPDSFEVLHDGEPVEITHFAEATPDAGVVPAIAGTEAIASAPAPIGEGVAAPQAEASPTHVVVYFDQTRLNPRRHAALVRSLESFLDSGSVGSEQVLILRQSAGLSVEASFGSSRAELSQALERLARSGAVGLDRDTQNRQALEAIRDGWERSQDIEGLALDGLASAPSNAGTGQPPGAGGGSGGRGPRSVVGGVGSGAGPDACGMFVNQIQPILDAWTRASRQRVANTLTNLASTAGFLAGLPGVKILLYLSDGLETQPGADLATYAGSLCPTAASELLTGTLAEQMTSGFLELTRHANTNRVTIYALQASGLVGPEAGDASGGRTARRGGSQAQGAFESRRRAEDRQGMSLIAEETGGRGVFNQNDLGPELLRIGETMQHYYSIAYQPPAGTVGGERRDHRIEVKLADGSLTARYRRGYVEKDETEWLTERIEGALNLGLSSNPLGVRLGAGVVEETAAGSYRVPLHIMVPVDRLAFLPQQDSFVSELTVRILSRAVDAPELATWDQTFRVQGSPDATGFANLAVALELRKGTHVTAIGVRDTNSREASFVSTTLQVGSDR